ncbi:MAG: nucleoside triphosphate pyrophosphohydrolase [Evtepia sp.]|uniref:nucleoside triphosphate pyrophosphohydrolase n=1 Tax=Evtepia sp. TaxID=2773933 RepID=UPI002A75FD22|nr:nucleoside triphosphate pyrophosphohydrolase [Evtepia sp.]MDY3013767.1 nucleoside triphosphate pyrophosphohydrolase [Evtepia sp.]
MINFEDKASYTVEDLREIVRLLRGPGGCPWDQVQTHESIRRNFIEEAYEVAEAIDEASTPHLKEELGDVLLQVFFHASIEEDAGRFTLDDVADGICKKLIFRHPHVFGTGQADSVGEVLTSWEELKRQEKGQATHTDTLKSVARSLPGLWRAEKIQSKAEKAGFEWPNVQAAMDKLEEELGELKAAVAENSNVEEELGDLLFAAVKIARFFGIDPETALAGTCDKFIRRFSGVEAAVAAQGQQMDQLSVDQLMALWNREKHPEDGN